MRQKALDFVFDLLIFDNPEQKSIMHDSYMLNMGSMIKYAHKAHIDELYYIFSIRHALLKSEGVHLK